MVLTCDGGSSAGQSTDNIEVVGSVGVTVLGYTSRVVTTP